MWDISHRAVVDTVQVTRYSIEDAQTKNWVADGEGAILALFCQSALLLNDSSKLGALRMSKPNEELRTGNHFGGMWVRRCNAISPSLAN